MILITGAGGKLGKELVGLFPDALTPNRTELDITNEKQVREYLKKHMPDTVIHLAAATSIPFCEGNKPEAWKTNVIGTVNLLKNCESSCYFVYMSTACIFDGKTGGYTEQDMPNPKNFYSLTKLVAETLVLNSTVERKLVIRSNFVAREKWPYEGAFVDRWGTYLFADQLALAIKEVMEAELSGVVHIAGDKKLSMYELAKMTTSEIKPIRYADFKSTVGYELTEDMTLNSIRWKRYAIK
jgi:dTDP-4-dehydrorhamnose reductase